MYKVKFADIGEGLTEGTVQEVFVKIGDQVKMGDPLFHVETDKMTSDIPAPTDGKIAKILIKQGQEIKVGDVVVEIEDGKTSTSVPVEENASVVGSTPVSNDLIARPTSPNPTSSVATNVIKASPLARKVAATLGVDLKLVTPSGPNGRILTIDVQSFKTQPTNQVGELKTISSSPKSSADYNNPKITVPVINEPLTFINKPMNSIRKATVKAMQKSHSEVAGFTGLRNVDVTELVQLRTQLKDFAESQNVKLTYLAFIIKASALVLKEMPNINCRIDKDTNSIAIAEQINIGMACDTPEGLLVPVIKGADKLSVLQIAVKINELANKARSKKLAVNEMVGATFTITNFGSVGLDYATPIINFPEAAILGLGTITTIPVYINGQLMPRDMMPFSMTADHRIIDGADAGRFMQKVAELLKKPAMLLI
ncbi:dihydrolipoamide acetyltransferase family protein [Spiroplasma clarkii]|uniref:Dihydrolipoamide acetyltransferase component of pyruvate dehydrogenase complex n=1 Tax=Spiroplasma clarkii TaxID=2139 RepID=A0A2K8KNG9_9MOLU|nr:dihydrolipoamide acetyltransferase family protein [Spiroplasma clarkii]ATX70516.1 pyruvate dehydrogenase E2 component (dihydrolipoamide acetyltransferase) [Spiroplasma clarkii]